MSTVANAKCEDRPHPPHPPPTDPTHSGFNPEEAAVYLRIIGYHATEHGFRPGKYRFKTKPGRPHPDELKITLTGNHVPDVMRRAAEWSAERHGFRKPKELDGPFRPNLP